MKVFAYGKWYTLEFQKYPSGRLGIILQSEQKRFLIPCVDVAPEVWPIKEDEVILQIFYGQEDLYLELISQGVLYPAKVERTVYHSTSKLCLCPLTSIAILAKNSAKLSACTYPRILLVRE